MLGNAPYGYRYLSKSAHGGEAAYEIHEPHAAVIKQLFEWVGRDRVSIYEATRRLRDKGIPTPKGGVRWDRSTVWKMLKNPAYQGSAMYGKTRVGARRPQVKPPRGVAKMPRRTGSVHLTDRSEQIEIAVPAIVSPELFAAVQEQLSDNRLQARERKSGARHLLQGLLECECCGYAYVGCSNVKSNRCYAYYRCVGSDAYRFGGKRVCENKQVRRDKLDEAVWNDACELIRDPNLLRKEYERRLALPETSTSELSLKKQFVSAQGTVNRLIDAYTDGVLNRDEFEPRIERARKRLADLETQMKSTQSHTREQSSLREALACLDSFAATITARLSDADFNTRREILRALIDRVVIGRDPIRIVYRVNFPLFAKKTNNGSFPQFCCRRSFASL